MAYSNLLPHLKKLARHLDDTIGEEKRKEILDGCESITAKSSKVLRSHIMRDVMLRMEKKMDKDQAIFVREQCACKPSNQLKVIRELYQNSEDLSAFISDLNKMGDQGKYELRDGYIYGSFNHDKCKCTMVTKTDENMPMLWCECCKGYVKWLFSSSLNKAVYVEMLETILRGADDCRFRILIKKEN